MKVVISDCHLSAGRVFENRLNPHEDFKFDEEMCEFFAYFSSGEYDEGPEGPVEVELILNGDFLDFLNVPYQGEFEDAVTETISLTKLQAILDGHPKVMAALRAFAAKPGKTITYLVGNHDADLFFPKVRERIIREWDPQGQFPSEKVAIYADRDRLRIEGGVEIHHGNQFEAVHVLDFEKPLLQTWLDEPVLNLPWGSLYVLKIVNRLKFEREYLDKVRPIRAFVIFGLILDPWFTLKYVLVSMLYFVKTRFTYSPKRRSSIIRTAEIVRQETSFWLDLEKQARAILDAEPEVRTVIFGHVHQPQSRVYPDGKQYLNTGTWTKMVNLDWGSIGQRFALTFALIRIRNGKAHTELRQWIGEQGPHRSYHS